MVDGLCFFNAEGYCVFSSTNVPPTTIPGLPTEVLKKNIQVQNKITDSQPVFLNDNLIIKFSEKLSLYPHFSNTGQRVLYRNAKYM